MQYLCDHPISAAEDISFLRSEILKRKGVAEEAEKEAESEKRLLLAGVSDKSAMKYKSWTGKYPYLRLIHAILILQHVLNIF